jgi:hypothetical protein
MAGYRTVLENEYPGTGAFIQSCLDPVFGPVQRAKRSLNGALSDADKTIVKDIFIFGSSNNFSFGEMNFFDVTVQDKVNIERNRVTIQRAVRKSLDSYQAAIVIFHYQNNQGFWRFSFINRGDGAGNTTPAKRYSYLCGKGHPCRTAAERFLTLEAIAEKKNLEQVVEAFSIEELTKQFYKEIFDWYQWALSDEMAIKYPNGSNTEEHLIRLITRLMFVWFIKQKGLIPEDIFDPKELSYVLKDFDPLSMKSGNYYNAILQNLFFATLNRPVNERKFTSDASRSFQGRNEHYGIKTLYRDDNKETWFKKPDKEIIEIFKRVPFLNGGLFECLDKENENGKIIYFDGFSRDKSKQKRAFVPNCLFFDDTKGLISILKRYNFTIEENTPFDVDVALDPELLGKVFENLLGAYNPETKETARKQSGSFYTPREIVSYMADESLIAYLIEKTGEQYESKIRKLFAGNAMDDKHIPLPNDIKSEICTTLQKCKILDPACGSGAFPMGILNRMLDILKKLRPDTNMYETKLQLIENCIYGVDIQTIAIQIAKLRFFISLICEQTPNDNPNINYGIIPLPNLESKFVAANTLIGLNEERKEELNLENEDLKQMKNELLDIRCHKSVRASSWQEKKQLRNEGKELCRKIKAHLFANSSRPDIDKIEKNEKQLEQYKTELADLPEIWVDDYQKAIQNDLFGNSRPQTLFKKDINSEKRNRITDRIKTLENEIAREKRKGRLSGLEGEIDNITGWDPYDQNASSPFFDPEWMFGVKDGFDVVIGNPPYRSLSKSDLTGKYDSANYETFIKSGDIYQLFYERGFNLLNQNGHLCLITSNKWMRAAYGEKTRTFFANKANAKILIDFAGQRVFESVTVDVNVILLKKKEDGNETLSCIIKEDCKTNMTDYIKQEGTRVSFPKDGKSWVILSDIEQRIKDKIEKIGKPLKDWDINIYRGILTGCNEAFIIDKEKRDGLIKKDVKSAEIIRPILRGRDIERYKINFAEFYLINTHNGIPSKKIPPIDIKEYPAIKEHLDQYWEKIKTREDQGITPYNLRSCAYMDDFSKQKITWGNLSLNASFTLAPVNMFINAPATMIVPSDKYLLGILNSKLADYFIRNLGVTRNGGYFEYKPMFVSQLPVPMTNDKERKTIELLVTEMLNLRKHHSDTSDIDFKLNNSIYNLYLLTDAEKRFIDLYESTNNI